MTLEPISILKFFTPYIISVLSAIGVSYSILNTEVAVLKSGFENLHSNNKPHDEKINTLSVNQYSILNKLDDHDKKFDELDAKFDKKFDKLDDKIDNLTVMIIDIIKEN